ncbi:uncharacterized protein [Acropora muricata]|uniref:uncharacterized protein n=1 Tax=Acropora muricata TaxID=159855 RepID=UPI0034E537BA
MIATIQDLDREPNQEAGGQTAAYLDACNLLFEQELLSRWRINNRGSPVLANIRRGMSFFEEWAAAHDDTVYADNSKKARLAWQVYIAIGPGIFYALWSMAFCHSVTCFLTM